MRVLVVMGSPRQGNTYRAAERIREHMQSIGEVEWEYLMLRDMDLRQCTGCFTCFEKGEEHCPIKDDGPALEQKLHDADGTIFATPVYAMNVSGLMKVFVDRLAYIFHRPRFFDKKALLLTTTGAMGIKEVLDYLDLVARIWGYEVVGRVGLVTPPTKGQMSPSRQSANDQSLRQAADAFYGSLLRGTRLPPSMRDVIIFHAQRASFDELREVSPLDYQYWKDHGWLDPDRKYFVNVPVNSFYDAIGRSTERRVRRQVRKDLVEVL